MKTESLQELIDLCRAGSCAVRLAATPSGIVAQVTSSRGHVNMETSVYLDRNDKKIAEKLEDAVRRVQ